MCLNHIDFLRNANDSMQYYYLIYTKNDRENIIFLYFLSENVQIRFLEYCYPNVVIPCIFVFFLLNEKTSSFGYKRKYIVKYE